MQRAVAWASRTSSSTWRRGPVAVPVVVLFTDSAAWAATLCSTAGGAASAGDETCQAATSGAAGILGTRSAWVRARGQGEHTRGASSGTCAHAAKKQGR